MGEQNQDQAELDRFILERIESVPRLEALLLVWRSRPRTWTVEEMRGRLYVDADRARSILESLVRDDLLSASPSSPKQYGYTSKSARQNRLIQTLDETYRRELVRITNLIHSKPPRAARRFARAFQIKKERE
jgi:hypothetical protein